MFVQTKRPPGYYVSFVAVVFVNCQSDGITLVCISYRWKIPRLEAPQVGRKQTAKDRIMTQVATFEIFIVLGINGSQR